MSKVMGEIGVAPFNKLFRNATEAPEPYQPTIKGAFPAWLTGTLLRTGPGMYELGGESYDHLFDGLAFLHRFRLEDGTVTHSAKYLRSETYSRNMASQRIVTSEFGTMAFPDPCKSIFSRYFAYYFPGKVTTDNDSVNILQHGDQVYATTETGVLNRIDPKTLETLERVNVSRYLAVNTATAHPHFGEDGTAYNAATTNGAYKIVAVPPATPEETEPYSKVKEVASVGFPPSRVSYYHSFGMSANNFVFVEMPLRISLAQLVAGNFTRKSFKDTMYWEGEADTVFHVLARSDGKPTGIRYTAPPLFTFHHANSYEEDGCLIVDMCGYPDGSAVPRLTLEELKQGNMPLLQKVEGEPSNLWRFVLPLRVAAGAEAGEDLLRAAKLTTEATATLQEDGSVRLGYECLGAHQMEFPRYNYARNGKAYRFVYATEVGPGLGGDALLKVDLATNTTKAWACEDEGGWAWVQELFPGEPVFVGRPGATEEDDGVVLCLVSSTKDHEASFLVALDGRSFEELGRAELKTWSPQGFHGHFVSD